MSDDNTENSSSDSPSDARRRWKSERTTFQRVYDVTTGITDYASASVIAERADCSSEGARDALAQLTEMGVVDQRGSRPAEYRRNESYFRWKRVETLAGEHTQAELRERLDDLLEEDANRQQSFGVPDLGAASIARIGDGDHAPVHDRLESLSR